MADSNDISQVIFKNEYVSLNTASDFNWSVTGYDFSGWKDLSGNIYTTDIQYSFLEDTVLNAYWTPKTYNVTSDGTNCTVTVASRGSYNTNLTIEWNGSDGYVFSSAKVYSGTSTSGTVLATFTSGTSGTFKMTDSYYTNIYIQVIYVEEPKEYSVTLDTDGGTINSGNITSYISKTETQLPTDVTKPGYKFDGWYTDKSGGTKVTSISESETGDKSYYAHWTDDFVTVNLNY